MTRLVRLTAIAATVLATTSPLASQQTTSALGERLHFYRPGVSTVEPLSHNELHSGGSEFRRDAAAWIGAGGAPDAPRRRLVVATYVIDMLKDVTDTAVWQSSEAGPALLEWACARLRDAAPMPVERAWHVAALALLERSSTPTVLARHLDHAEARFTNEDRWPLARAVVDEWESEAGQRDDGTRTVSGGRLTRALQHFQQAAARPSVRQEALLRWAAYESDLGKHDAALAHLDQIGQSSDQYIRYWAALIRGRTLRRAGRNDDAIQAYRAAVAEFPTAQSGALGLASALVGAHRALEASTIVARVATGDAAAAAPDPWTMYRSPDVRFWPRALDDLRQAVAP